MHKLLADDLGNFDAILDNAHKDALAYLHGLGDRAASARVARDRIPVNAELADRGAGAQAALRRFHNEYGALLSASPGPRYFGFVTGGSTPAALAADWLVSAFDQNAQLNDDTCAPYLEAQAIDMLKQLLGWPREWSGTCVTGATMANFVGLALARQWWGEQFGRDIAAHGLAGLPGPTILAGSAHSSTGKALAMLGLGRSTLRTIALAPQREALDVVALETALIEQGDGPCIVVASAGTVNTVDFDDLAAIAELKTRHRFWLHVDAAFGGVAAASVRYRGLLCGIEAADSVTVDAHKWLNVPYDCAIAFTTDVARQVKVFGNHSPYLSAPEAAAHNYLHLAPENSRRFRALPLWMSLQAYGREGYAEIVERNCDAARRLGELVRGDPRLRLAAPVRLNVVCFALANDDVEGLLRLRTDLHASGVAYVSPSRLHGRAVLRAAICNWRTTMADVERTFATLASLLDASA